MDSKLAVYLAKQEIHVHGRQPVGRTARVGASARCFA